MFHIHSYFLEYPAHPLHTNALHYLLDMYSGSQRLLLHDKLVNLCQLLRGILGGSLVGCHVFLYFVVLLRLVAVQIHH